jgi:hypothetical protein
VRGTKHARLTLAVLILTSSALEAQVRAGGEFRVNTYTTGHQYFPAAAYDRDGDFVVIWSSYEGGARRTEVKGQRYLFDGLPWGAEFLVNATTTGYQYTNQIGTPLAMRPDGRFVVVWSNVPALGTSDIRARLFEPRGAPTDAEFQVNLGGAGRAYYPNVDMGESGDFVVVWSGDVPANPDVFGQRFDRTGNRLGATFRVNTTTAGIQTAPRVAVEGDGSFVVVWQDRGANDGSGHGVFGQRFASDGSPLGGEFQVNTTTTGNQFAYAVACAADGRFVVSWDGTGDGSGFGIFGQRYDATGVPDGPEFLVNQATTAEQVMSSVSSDLRFNFVTAWQSTSADGSGYGIRGQRFDALGARRGAELQVNTYTTLSQNAANVASDEVGNFLVTWQSDRQDGSDLGVFAQRFGGLHPRLMRVDPTGNGVLEPGETVSMMPSWGNATGAQLMFTGALTEPEGPAGGVPIIVGAAATYVVSGGAAGECMTCFTVEAPDPTPRPGVHWDGTVVETISPAVQGQEKTWRLHVGASFSDVLPVNAFYPWVETLLHHGITGGCTATTYCPGSPTSREQMAVFVLVAREGAGYVPPACGAVPMFLDVPAASPFCRWVEELARRGVVSGCGGGNYCPVATVSREQMAVFVLRAFDPTVIPPACVPPNLFADVPETSPFCRWIESLAVRGVVGGCGGGNYCPTAPVTREQMGVFISLTFGLALYGP